MNHGKNLLSVLAIACLCAAPAVAQQPAASAPAPAAVTNASAAPVANADENENTNRFARWRAHWAERGVETAAGMTGLWIGDMAGGAAKGGVYNTLGTFSATADLEKSTGWWKGGTAYASVYWIRGRSVTFEYVHDALAVSNLDGFDSIRLYDAYLQQSFFGDAANLRAGSIGADEEFAGTDYGAMFTNSVFGWDAGIGANIVNGGPIYFAPGLGVRAEVHPDADWTLRAGLYDGDTFDSPDGDPGVNPHGLHFQLSKQQGTFRLAEAVHTWNSGDDAEGQPGWAKFGVWGHTAAFEDVYADANGQSFALSGLDPATHSGNAGWYGAFQQQLWSAGKDDPRMFGLWLRIGTGRRDRSAYEWVSDYGCNWTGPIPARANDVFGIGIATAYVSRDAIAAARDAQLVNGGTDPLPDYERVVETAYQFKVDSHWTVTPTLQYVQHPGASAAEKNAWVPGLRVSVQ